MTYGHLDQRLALGHHDGDLDARLDELVGVGVLLEHRVLRRTVGIGAVVDRDLEPGRAELGPGVGLAHPDHVGHAVLLGR